MLLEDMVGKNSGGSPKIENLASISEVPGDVSSELSIYRIFSIPLTFYLQPVQGRVRVPRRRKPMATLV